MELSWSSHGGEQLLEAMLAQGLAPSIYTLSVVVKCLGAFGPRELLGILQHSLTFSVVLGLFLGGKSK
jgi:hypothetical protein